MKLFSRYNRVNVLASVLAFLLGSVCYYFIIRYVLIKQLDDTLKVEEAEILDFVRTKDRLPEPSNYRDQQIRFIPSDNPPSRRFINADWYDIRHKEVRTFRQLLFPVTAAGHSYSVSVSKSEEETEDLLGWIVLITLGVIGLLLGIQFLLGRFLLRRLWRPFYNTLEAIGRFHLSSHKPLPVNDTRIEEFINLDKAVAQMTGKILHDYEMLKNFADNASHEMQTPLAIINSKLDLMIQDQGLEEKHLRQLQAMYDAVGRLTKLNQSLLLLTKIENRQFIHTGEVGLAPLIEEKLVQLEELIRAANLDVRTDLDKVSAHLNAYLADILLNNLLVNAIRHNQEGGSLTVVLRARELRIINTGPALGFDPSTIFDRFTRSSRSPGTGLGLAIVKQICDNYGYALSYTYSEQTHSVVVRFG